MEFANRVVGDELVMVYAEKLKDTELSRYGYTCPYEGCGIEVALCSYLSSNFKAPYFARRYKNYPHTESCPSLRDDSTDRSLGTDKSKPIEYISKLIFDLEEKADTHQLSYEDRLDDENAFNRSENHHNHTARHIAPLIRWYTENPTLGDKRLQVPESEYSTYAEIFQKLDSFSAEQYSGRHIYFGSLFVMRPPEKRLGEIILTVFQFNFEEPIQVILDTRSWSKAEISLTSDWIDEALTENHESIRTNKNGSNKNIIYPYIFFLGNAEPDGRRFRCDRHEAFYAMATRSLKLKTMGLGVRRTVYSSVESEILQPKISHADEASDRRNTAVSELRLSKDSQEELVNSTADSRTPPHIDVFNHTREFSPDNQSNNIREQSVADLPGEISKNIKSTVPLTPLKNSIFMRVKKFLGNWLGSQT